MPILGSFGHGLPVSLGLHLGLRNASSEVRLTIVMRTTGQLNEQCRRRKEWRSQP
jgi:transketolase N-terminal domain/subunit